MTRRPTHEPTRVAELAPGDVVDFQPDWLNERVQRRTVESIMRQAPSKFDAPGEVGYLVTFVDGSILAADSEQVEQVVVR